MTTLNIARPPVRAEVGLHNELSQFYADHMAALDRGDTAGFARGFVPEATFAASGFDRLVFGREQIEAAAAAGVEQRARDGITHRHLMSMLRVVPRTAWLVRATSYVLVIETGTTGTSGIYASTLCEDILVRRDDRWQIRARKVTRDDKPWRT
ncbi:MAG TPA: nuclear transport factor 2 family protein [Actinophytocola sp.]|uniref:nuclear transport factor 2 family protein n=1 Tax=Actinophytocola sp. TaxID=1872138 RepID=UPI002DBE58A1|nr:nuclear transport factor 2 family protein [Actinophytocola sp.]HEU5473636.1 nuclear transport factor 2 family protein [Actinophytocola sp.]